MPPAASTVLLVLTRHPSFQGSRSLGQPISKSGGPPSALVESGTARTPVAPARRRIALSIADGVKNLNGSSVRERKFGKAGGTTRVDQEWEQTMPDCKGRMFENKYF